MKKLLASALAVSMVAGMAISASAADIKNLQLAGNLVNDTDLKDAYAVDYASVDNRDSYELPDNWGNDGYESDKIAPVLVYGDTKEYNVLIYNLNDSVDVHVNSGKIRVSTRKYAAKEADHDGNLYPTSRTMDNAYSAVDQFGLQYSYVDSVVVPSSYDSSADYTFTSSDVKRKSAWIMLSNDDTNGDVDVAATSSGSNLDGTIVVDAVPSYTPTKTSDNIKINNKSSVTVTSPSPAENTWWWTNGSLTLSAATKVDNTTDAFTIPGSAISTGSARIAGNGTKAKAYITTSRVNGTNYIVASKDYTFYTVEGGGTRIEQHKVAKGCYVDVNGYPVDPDDRVEAAQYAYANGLDDTNLGTGATIDKGTSAVVLTIKSNHGPRDVKVEDFKIEVDVKDGNTFFIEGASGYSNIRDVVDDDRLTNQEDDDKGCVYNFGEKIYETARIRCTDYVDLYFNGNYDTNKENLRVSTDEIAEIKNYFEDYDIDFVNFIARPKFATPVTVIIDADKNSFIYEYNESTGDVTLMNDDKATYDSTDGWKFKDNTLGIYLVFEEEYENANVKADKSAPVEEPEEPEEPSASEAPSTSTEKPNPGTGANDMVGAAAALAVVSLVACGAVAVKKLSK